ncbi:MAG: PDZ domain-containing protein, partial [Phycisphaerales bacterium]|nr:PDZ domain-containing protein [Phycisphaerales bacterium]
RTGSPADTAGVESGDIILRINAKSVDNVHTLKTMVANLVKAKGEAAVIVRRGRSEKTLVINLGTNS